MTYTNTLYRSLCAKYFQIIGPFMRSIMTDYAANYAFLEFFYSISGKYALVRYNVI